MLIPSKHASLAFIAVLALATSESQAQARFPEMDEVRAWIQEHQPKLATGDSGMNAAIIVIDTNAKYLKSVAFRLSERELATMDPMTHAVTIQDDAAIKNILYSCVRTEKEGPAPTKPMCMLDGVRVAAIDNVRFMTGRDLQVMKADSAVRRFGPDAVHGAVLLATDTAALDRFKSLGVTPTNLVSFEGRRIRRRSDGAAVVITVLMVR
jgi:hypothetical protein